MDDVRVVTPVGGLILDLLAFVGPCGRGYSEVMDAWRTSCPRMPIWEEALDQRLIKIDDAKVYLTEAGKAHLSTRT